MLIKDAAPVPGEADPVGTLFFVLALFHSGADRERRWRRPSGRLRRPLLRNVLAAISMGISFYESRN
jgi:hypothetical protein